MTDDAKREGKVYETYEPISPEASELSKYSWLRKKPRRYEVIQELLPAAVGEGAYGKVLKCFAIDRAGKQIKCGHDLVIKLARKDHTHNGVRISDSRIMERLDRVRANNLHEYKHIRRRLLHGTECDYANPIIDHGFLERGNFHIPFTVQRFVSEAHDLDSWLYEKKYRTEKALTGEDRFEKSNQNWTGMESLDDWLALCIPIAKALVELHMRRVTHGDIHPGNIFLTKQPPTKAILIDFGESKLFLPANLQFRERRDQPYLAPEMKKPCHLNEKIDVYAFGQLAIYLACGFETVLEYTPEVHRHKEIIDGLICESKHMYLRDELRMLDLIGRATSRDPVDRPRMFDIERDLKQMLPPKLVPVINEPSEQLKGLVRNLAKSKAEHPLFMSLLSLEVEELEHAFDGLRTEMVQFTGTRDHALRMLISIYDSLQKGDSWTSATTLDLWQHYALGCNGSYDSANIRAVKRGVTISRAFIISVEEVGEPFATSLLNAMKGRKDKAKDKLFDLLARHLDSAIKKFKKDGRPSNLNTATMSWRRARLHRVVNAFATNVARWSLESHLNLESQFDPEESQGFALSLCLQGTLEDVVKLRQQNPLSIIHFAESSKVESSKVESSKYILVATDAQGRRTGSEPPSPKQRYKANTEMVLPHLTGLRVLASVENDENDPSDRRKFMQNLFNDSPLKKDLSVNIASVASEIARMIEQSIRMIKQTKG